MALNIVKTINVNKKINKTILIKSYTILIDNNIMKIQLNLKNISNNIINGFKVTYKQDNVDKEHIVTDLSINRLDEFIEEIKLEVLSDNISNLEISDFIVSENIDSKYIEKKDNKLLKKLLLIGVSSLSVLLSAILLIILLFVPLKKYNDAMELLGNKKYDEAREILKELDTFKDSKEQIDVVNAAECFDNKDYETGIDYLVNIGGLVEVNYDSNGGEAPKANEIIKKTKYIDNDTQKVGYKFCGWHLEKYEINIEEYTAKIDLKAEYDLVEYSLFFNLNGGQFNNAPKSKYTYLDEDIKIENPYRNGYEFIGWTGLDLEEPTLNLVIKQGSVGARVYTANYKAIEYNITYDLNGGELTLPNPSTYTIEDKIVLNNPTKEGYDFIGWTGEGITTPTIDLIISRGSYGNREYVAHYEEAEYKLNYYYNDEIVYTEDIVFNDSFYIPVDFEYDGNTYIIKQVTFNNETYYPNDYIRYKISDDSNLYIEADGIVSYSFAYEVDDNGYAHVSSYYGNSSEITIPDYVPIDILPDGIDFPYYRVKGIADKAFYENNNITKITVGENIEIIGNSAFYGCSNLTTVILPSSLVSIGDSAFYNCFSLNTIDLPESLISLGSFAFCNCYKLESIEIPSGIIEIKESTFESCGLSNIVLNEGLIVIGDRSFASCGSMKNIIFPNTLERIGDYSFVSTGIVDIIIPDSVTSLGSYTFAGCTSLSNAKLPNKIKYIGWRLFSECSMLSEIDIPEGVTSIDDYAFSYCTALTNINLPSTLKIIGNSAFSFCSNLQITELPEGVTRIGSEVFQLCEKISYLVLPSTLQEIGFFAFEGTSISEIIIPSSMTNIGSGAFTFASALKNIRLHNEIISIEEQAFENCSSLEYIIIPESVTNIGRDAFRFCEMLEIYCEASSQPNGWDNNFNSDNRPIYYGVEWDYVDGVPTPYPIISISEALRIASEVGNDYSTEKYYVKGTITEIYNDTYGNMYITDGIDTINIYGTYSKDGTLRYDSMEIKPVVGDIVLLYGVLGVGVFDNSSTGAKTPQMKNVWMISHIVTPKPYEVTVYYYNSLNWTTINCYSYDANGNQANGEWPGTAMNQVEGRENWYYVTLEIIEACTIIFNNGTTQTDDISDVFETSYFYGYNTTAYKSFEETEEAKIEDEYTTVYYYNSLNWATVNCYALDDNNSPINEEWPGAAMSAVEGKDNWYYLTFRVGGAISVIFNNGTGAQTINFENIYNSSYFYGLDSNVYESFEAVEELQVPIVPAPVEGYYFEYTLPNWDPIAEKPTFYYWGTNANVEWPGEAMTLVEGTTATYCVTVNASVVFDGIILTFEQSGQLRQSKDITENLPTEPGRYELSYSELTWEDNIFGGITIVAL